MLAEPKLAYYTFDEVVRLICSYLDDPQALSKYVKVAKGLMIALDDLNLHTFPRIKTARLIVKDNLTVDLPEDFVAISKVGLCCDNGNIQPIIRNTNLCPPKEEEKFFKCCDCKKETDDEGNIDEEKSESCHRCTFYNYSISSTYGSVDYPYTYSKYYFGYKPNMYVAGSYDLDEVNQRLIIGTGCQVEQGTEIIVEYNAANDDDSYMMIPKKAYLTLQHYVAHWAKSNKQPQVARYEFDLFRRHRDNLKRSLLRYTAEDLLAALRSGYRSSPKR